MAAKRKTIGILAALAIGLGAGVAVALLVVRIGEEHTSEVLLGTFQVKTANAQAAPSMSREAAETAARRAAAPKIGETIASTARLGGHTVGVADYLLKDGAFAPAAFEVSSLVSNFRYRSDQPADLWAFIFEIKGVELTDWGITGGVVEVDVVINDKSGKPESASVLAYNPHAQ